MRNIITCCLITVVLAGCVQLPNLTNISENNISIQEKSTEKNIIHNANIGESIYTYNKFNLLNTYGFKNLSPIIYNTPYWSGWDGITFDKHKKSIILTDTLLNNTHIFKNEKEKHETWILNDSLQRHFDGILYHWPYYFVIVNNHIEKISYTAMNRSSLISPPVKVEKVNYEKRLDNIFSYELIYSGIQNNSIVINYREFTNDLIRSNFSQTYYYAISDLKDNIIKYKNIKIKILEYDNQSIKYSVID